MRLNPEWLKWKETQTLLAAFNPGELQFVGGAVRDTVLGRVVHEVDVATTCPPGTTIALLENAGLRGLPTGVKHGTVTAVVGERTFEITTLRKDISTDGRHAEVVFTEDWKEDAARRDFTMNALYLSPSGELTDYYGGIDDAKAGRVRFIGNAADRISEDYLRILRYFRFIAWYGKEDPDKDTLRACERLASGIARLSGERIQQEMFKLLAASLPSQAVLQMGPMTIQQTFGGRVNIDRLMQLERVEALSGYAVDPILRLSALLSGADVQVGIKWKLSHAMDSRLKTLASNASTVHEALTLPEQKKILRRVGADVFKQLVMLSWASRTEVETLLGAYRLMLGLADIWTPPVFPVTGADLKMAGVPEGREMGQVLKKLETAWEEAGYGMAKDELLKMAKA